MKEPLQRYPDSRPHQGSCAGQPHARRPSSAAKRRDATQAV